MKNLFIFGCLLLVSISFSEGAGIDRSKRFVDDGCTDAYVWIADGSVDCQYLVRASSWGLHKDPDHWCNHYGLTDCCETCTRLREEKIIN